MSKDDWIAEVEHTTDGFAFDRLTREEAVSKLVRLGFYEGEAEIMLDEAIS